MIPYFRYDRSNISEEARSRHISCNVWGYMFMHGVDVTRNEGRFTAEMYIDILQNFFLHSLQRRAFPFPLGPIVTQPG